MSFRKQAQVALGMDAPRIMRKDMTTITELIAKYQGIEAALNATKFEESAEVVSGVAQPLMQARGMLELALEKLTESNAPTLAGISPEESETAQNVAFALEDQLMAYLEETKKKPSEVRVKPELFALLQEAWPGVTELPFAGGKITLIEAGPNQAADFVFDARASS